MCRGTLGNTQELLERLLALTDLLPNTNNIVIEIYTHNNFLKSLRIIVAASRGMGCTHLHIETLLSL